MMKMDGSSVILAAHRGDKARFPENTMPAFVAAEKAGVDMIETDIHMTADGVLVLFHDRSGLRTTGVDRNLDEMTISEVLELDAGAIFSPEFAGTKVPTVEEFAEWLKGNDLLINWELKDYPTEVGDAHAFAAADKLIDLIERCGLAERSMVNSFSPRVLEHIYRRQGKKMPIHGQGIYKKKKYKDEAEIAPEELFDWCCLYPVEKGTLAMDVPENFKYCMDHGILPCVCVKDTEENYSRALELGCRMFTSNDILEADRILRLLGVR